MELTTLRAYVWTSYLNRKEFMAWAGTQRGSAVARKLDASFRAFDARHKGRLSKGERQRFPITLAY
jgi:Ca2+-binding EF-hand superfamily protein